MEWTLILFVLSIVFFLISKINQLESKVKAQDNQLKRIEQEIDLPEHPVYKDIRENIRIGNETKAVKLARQTFGISLMEGKQLVDELRSEVLRNHSK